MNMNTVKYAKHNVKTVAHRGVSGLECENTAAAFIAAGQRTHFGVETDIHKTADGYFVCMHDDNIERVSGKNMVIEESTLEELSAICLYEKGTTEPRGYLRIPLLSDYIAICKKYGKHCVAEIKGVMESEDLKRIISEFEAENWLCNTTFIAFNFVNLTRIREILPSQSVQFLTCDITDELIELLVSHKMDLDVLYKALTEENIKKLHENGIVINCWTVDDPAAGRQLAEWGVDQITSNILE